MNKKELINNILELEDCHPVALLWYRMVLDVPNDIVNLQQDVLDLYLFPERLQESYRNEWQVYIRKALMQRCTEQVLTGNIILECVAQAEAEIRFSETEQKEMIKVVEQIINTADKLLPFPSKLRKNIEDLLKI